MLSKLKISSRVVLLGVLPLAMLVLVLLAAFWSAQQKDALFNELYENHLAILADVMLVQQVLQQSALQDIRKYRTGWASAEATQNAINQYLDLSQHHWQLFVSQRPQLEGDASYDALDQAFAGAIQHYQSWIAYAGTDALLVRILNESTVNSEIERHIQSFSALADEFIHQQIAAGSKVRESAERFTNQLVFAFVWGGSILLLLIIALIWAVKRSVCQPLWCLRDMLQRVQQDADLTLRADDAGKDEVAEAARALNQMMAHFQTLVVALGRSSDTLNEQAARVYDSSDAVGQGTIRQQGQANQLATAIEQMSVSVHDVALNAQEAATSAQQATLECAAGRQVATASAQGISALAQQIDHSAQVVKRLQVESGQISGVVNVIRKISEQTNLLALNAAIEAARAGEAGRGFSVVADEVRNLSANTKTATESINAMVSQLQQQAISAVETMQRAHHDADHNVSLAQEAGARFHELAERVEKISDANVMICTATEQQRVVADDIAKNIHAFNGDVMTLSHSATEAASASDKLNGLARQLQADCSVFRVVARLAR